MKHAILFLFLVSSLSTFANEVLLDSKVININSDRATVLRTNNTPNNVELVMRVPLAGSVCEYYDTRSVLITSGLRCGYNTHVRRITEKHCVRKNQRGQCTRYENRTRQVTSRTPRTCHVSENYCAQYGTATSYKNDTVKIQFKNLPALGDSEVDKFEVEALQKNYNGSNVDFIITPVETLREYKVKQKKFLGLFSKDSFVIEEK